MPLAARLTGVIVAVAALPGCDTRPPMPPPAVLSQAPTPTTTAAAASLDPSEPGISDLARLARHVFKVMAARQRECAIKGLPPGRLSYQIDVEVREGRIAAASLGGVSAMSSREPVPLARPDWPVPILEFVRCLEPHLVGLALAPAPADGAYPARFLTTTGDDESPQQPAQ